MSELPPITPHFVGAFAAVVGLAALAMLSMRPEVRANLGRRGYILALSLLLGVGAFGNGVAGVAYQGFVSPETTSTIALRFDTPRMDKGFDRALRVALSPEFLRYHAKLSGVRRLPFDGDYVRDRLRVERGPARELLEDEESRALSRRARVYRLNYHDVENFAFVALRRRDDARPAALEYVQVLAQELDELLLLELYRASTRDSERLAVLEMIERSGVPYYAEWVVRELRGFRLGRPSSRVVEVLDRQIDAVQAYVDDPTLRDLPADVRIVLR